MKKRNVGFAIGAAVVLVFILGANFGMSLLVADENYNIAQGANNGCYEWTWPFNFFAPMGCSVNRNLSIDFVWAVGSIIGASALVFAIAYTLRRKR